MYVRSCPVSQLMPVLQGQWMFQLFVALKQASTFGQLKKTLKPITSKVLTDHLRKAVAAKCVAKSDAGYALTAQGAKVIEHLRAFVDERCKSCDGQAVCVTQSF